jgi:hypothetical protein
MKYYTLIVRQQLQKRKMVGKPEDKRWRRRWEDNIKTKIEDRV